MLKASCLRLQDPYTLSSVGVCGTDEVILLAPVPLTDTELGVCLLNLEKIILSPRDWPGIMGLPDLLVGELDLGFSTGI